MNARLKALEGTGADIHADTLLGDILLPLGVSRTADFTRRTYDAVRQPFTGWGLMWTRDDVRSEEHTSELQSLMRISYAVFCLKKKKHQKVQSINTVSVTM